MSFVTLGIANANLFSHRRFDWCIDIFVSMKSTVQSFQVGQVEERSVITRRKSRVLDK